MSSFIGRDDLVGECEEDENHDKKRGMTRGQRRLLLAVPAELGA